MEETQYFRLRVSRSTKHIEQATLHRFVDSQAVCFKPHWGLSCVCFAHARLGPIVYCKAICLKDAMGIVKLSEVSIVVLHAS